MVRYKQITHCRCCQGTDLHPYFDMGLMPLANSIRVGKTPSNLYPLNVNVCSNCFHSQLSIVVDREVLFGNYPYVSGISKTFQQHCLGMVQDILIDYHRPKVLDIAANDGTLLEVFSKYGCQVLGIDPAENLIPLSAERGVPVLCDYWSKSVAESLGNKFDVITATNVLAHIDEVDDFLQACAKVLTRNGTLVIEVPYNRDLIEKCEFDTIYHEHLSYFLVSSFRHLIRRNGFYISRILPISVHGGSLRFYLKLQPGEDAGMDFILAEKKVGLQDYFHFQKRVQFNRNKLLLLLNQRLKQGEKVVGFGASAKGNTCINYFDLSLDYVVDDTFTKQGKYISGKDIFIEHPSKLESEDGPLNILIFVWNFYDEIKQRISTVRKGKTDRLISYVPEISGEVVKWG